MLIESKRAASFSGPKMPPGIWKEPFQAKNLTFCSQAEEYLESHLSKEFLDDAGDCAERIVLDVHQPALGGNLCDFYV